MTKQHRIGGIFGIALILIGGGLGWQVFHPRPLHIGIRVQPATTANPLMGDPLATRLSLLPPNAPPQNEITGVQCVWTLQSVQYRRNAKEPWKTAMPVSQVQKAPVDLYSRTQKAGFSDIFFPRYSQPGEWKSLVRADVSVQTRWSRWRGNASHEFHDIVTARDLKSRAAKRLLVARQNARAMAMDAQDSVPKGAVALVPGKRYIGKIQWSEDAAQSWHDMPAAGKGALAVPELTSLGLRAVRADPKTKWPDYPDFLPFWTYAGQKYFGDTVVLQMQRVSSDDSDLRTATVHCGQNMDAKVRVLPSGELVVYAANETQINPKDSKRNRKFLSVYARSAVRNVPRGAKILFAAFYANGTRADLIDKPGFKDDTAPLSNNRASAQLPKVVSQVQLQLSLNCSIKPIRRSRIPMSMPSSTSPRPRQLLRLTPSNSACPATLKLP